MERAPAKQDSAIREAVLSFPSDDSYWSFQGRSDREFSHAYLQYPAMMVPQMQGEILDHICRAFPRTRHVWDPFVGSGTSLGECMLRGLDFSGNDINPLAVLVSKTKGGPLRVDAIREKARELYSKICADKSEQIDVDFPGRDKWFTQSASIQLSRIRRAILSEPALWARRFFWVVLAETIRLTSNSRTSTFKLHIRSIDDLAKERKDPIQVFKTTLESNCSHLGAFKERLSESGYINRGRYLGRIDISLRNTTKLHHHFLRNRGADLIITSPPYGDNHTTIPYGQYSYLPLNWIVLEDIDDDATSEFVETTCAIDSMSLGGSRRDAKRKAGVLSEASETFSALYSKLEKRSDDAAKKVSAFFYDLDSCIDPLLKRLNSGGNMVWTLGNRTVANVTIPLDTILTELFVARGLQLSAQFERSIPTKRMAGRNNVSVTMTRETILLLHKPTNEHQ